MIKPEEVKQVDSGSGYFIGEITKRHKHLDYLEAGAIVTLFDGVASALDFVSEKMPEPKQGRSSVKEGNGNFNSFKTYEEAMQIFRASPDKVVKFDPGELRVRDVNESGTQVEYDVTGDYIDIGRYLEGIPEVMGSMHSGNARNRRVNLVVNINQNWRIDQDVIKHRGERILRLVDALEAGGVRAMITAIESSECNHSEFVIKHHDEPLTISDLAVVTHPEFLRRVIFRIIEHSKTFQYGYGGAMSFGRALTPASVEDDSLNEINIVLDSNHYDVEDIDRLYDQLERLLVWELSKPVPEVSAIKLDNSCVHFKANGARAEADIVREGKEAIYER